jgi:hypothetical protein
MPRADAEPPAIAINKLSNSVVERKFMRFS